MRDVQCYELFGGITLKNHACVKETPLNKHIKWHLIIIIIIMVIFKCNLSGKLIALS